jgi:hypothetical protein
MKALNFRTFFMFAIVVTLLSSCTVLRKTLKGANSLKEISVESTADSNLSAPLALDIVFIYDDEIASSLREMHSPHWFDSKVNLMVRFGNDIDVMHLEIVPLSPMHVAVLPVMHKKAKTILLFANYRDRNGQYVAELSQFKQLKIHCLSGNYRLIELDE